MGSDEWYTDMDDDSDTHPHGQHLLKLQRRTENHQRIEEYWQTMVQLTEGRPDLLWSPCGKSGCKSFTCIPSPTHHCDFYFKRRGKKGQNGPDYVWQIVDKLGDVIWPEAGDDVGKISREMILGSFFRSPPVRSAYYLFKEASSRKLRNNGRKRIQAAICEATPFVEKVISEPDLPEHHEIICWYLGPTFADVHREERTLGDAVVRYMLCCEMWRRYPAERRESWSFGPPKVICDLYGGMILAMRTLEHFGLVARRRVHHNRYRNLIWAEWIRDYPLCTVLKAPYAEDGFIVRSAYRPKQDKEVGRTEARVLEEVGYLGGVGTYQPTPFRKVTRSVANLHSPDTIF